MVFCRAKGPVTQLQYRAEIDGLRAVAVLPVILFHAGFDVFGGGFVGVDVFFVISGYLITSIISSDLSKGTFSLAMFYERRARRILPALFLVTAVCIPCAWMLLMPRDLDEFFQSLVAVATFWSNFFFWNQSGYFAISAELKPLLHTWSLAVEEQYYILFPLFLLITYRFGRARVMTLLLAIAAVSLLTAQLVSVYSPEAAFFLPHTRAWELLLGSAVALHLRGEHRRQTGTSLNEAFSALGVILILASVFVFDRTTPFPGIYALVPTVGTALIILHAQPATIVHRILSNRMLVGIGLVSYSAYLWHQPLFAFAKYTSHGELGAPLLILLCILPFPLAYLTWRFVEQPFRNGLVVSRRRLAHVITSSAMLVVVGILAFDGSEVDNRLTSNRRVVDGDIGHAEFHQFLAESYFPCQPGEMADRALMWKDFRRCVQSKPADRIDVALIGDSHAEHLFPGVAAGLSDKNVVYLVRHGGPLIDSPAYGPIFDAVAADDNIEEVILAMFWSRSLSHSTDTSHLERRVRSTIEYLVRHGKRVVLAGDVPSYKFDPQQCKYSLRFSGDARCEANEDVVVGYEERTLLSGVAASYGFVDYVHLRDLLCDQGVCRMDMDGTIFYRDGNHLNIPGSHYIGAKLVERSSSTIFQ